jgi:hypothetical protein
MMVGYVLREFCADFGIAVAISGNIGGGGSPEWIGRQQGVLREFRSGMGGDVVNLRDFLTRIRYRGRRLAAVDLLVLRAWVAVTELYPAVDYRAPIPMIRALAAT